MRRVLVHILFLLGLSGSGCDSATDEQLFGFSEEVPYRYPGNCWNCPGSTCPAAGMRCNDNNPATGMPRGCPAGSWCDSGGAGCCCDNATLPQPPLGRRTFTTYKRIACNEDCRNLGGGGGTPCPNRAGNKCWVTEGHCANTDTPINDVGLDPDPARGYRICRCRVRCTPQLPTGNTYEGCAHGGYMKCPALVCSSRTMITAPCEQKEFYCKRPPGAPPPKPEDELGREGVGDEPKLSAIEDGTCPPEGQTGVYSEDDLSCSSCKPCYAPPCDPCDSYYGDAGGGDDGGTGGYGGDAGTAPPETIASETPPRDPRPDMVDEDPIEEDNTVPPEDLVFPPWQCPSSGGGGDAGSPEPTPLDAGTADPLYVPEETP